MVLPKAFCKCQPYKAKSIEHTGRHLPSSEDWYGQVHVIPRALPCLRGSAQCFLSDSLNRSRIGQNITFPYVFESGLGKYNSIFMTECVVLDLSSKVPIFPLTLNTSCHTDFINVAYTLKVKQTLKQKLKHWDESRLCGSAWT